MKIGSILFAKAKSLPGKGPTAPFSRYGKSFDQLFVAPHRKPKAWDGQDKDAFFRDKYAHVHAKQLKRRKEEKAAKLNKLGGVTPSPAAAPAPRPDFARRLMDRLERNHHLEYIYGTNAVKAALESSRPVAKVLTGFNSVADMDPRIVELARQQDLPIEFRVPQQHLQILSANGVHNKYVVETQKLHLPAVQSLEISEDNATLVANDSTVIPVKSESRGFCAPLGLYIDQVTDTHNMGALLRSALWFGVDFVAFSSRNCAPLSPAVAKASSGSCEFVPLLEVPYPIRFFDRLKTGGWNIVATAPNPTTLRSHNTSLKNVDAGRLREQLDGTPSLLVVGSEGDGIRTNLLLRSTHSTTLSTAQQHVDSLNVSVAAAVLLNSLCSK